MIDGRINSYEEAMRFLLEFTDYEKVTKYKYDLATFDLRRVVRLMEAVGHPQQAFRSVHIAGTKGKGSTAAMVQSILTAAGHRTGLYTSPHLCRLEERMTVDGQMMSENELIEIVNEVAPYTRLQRAERPNESPTYFELVTAIGFRHFARRRVELAAVEVGMGGRLDATNVILPEVSVITRIDYDHEDRLGHTLEKIAFEKAGIIKPSIPVVCAPQEAEAMCVVEEVASQRSAPLRTVGREYQISNVHTGLRADSSPHCTFDLKGPERSFSGLLVRALGAHQAINAACAVAAIDVLSERLKLRITESAIRTGLASVQCPARLEIFPGQPVIMLDGAHNPASIRALCAALDAVLSGKPLVLLMGVSRDKNAAEMFRLLLSRARKVIFTRSDSPRAADPETLVQLARETCGVEAEGIQDAHAALARAREVALPSDLLCITGSFFLAGMLRPTLVAGTAGPGGTCTAQNGKAL